MLVAANDKDDWGFEVSMVGFGIGVVKPSLFTIFIHEKSDFWKEANPLKRRRVAVYSDPSGSYTLGECGPDGTATYNVRGRLSAYWRAKM